MRGRHIEFDRAWTRLALENTCRECNVDLNWRAEFRPLARRHWYAAAVRMAKRICRKLCRLRLMRVHLPHATGMRLHIARARTIQRDSRKRQSHGSKHAHQENNKGRSGRHPMHKG
jgi:hypothetical protein